MRYVYLVLVAIFTVAVLVFSFQNFSSVTLEFLSWELTAPLWSVVALAYIGGMLSGGLMLGFFRRAIAASHHAEEEPVR